MAPATRILKCDVQAVVFPQGTDQPTVSSQDTHDALRTAADHLLSGNTVVFPTETVYGLGALALDDKAAAKIFETKGRPPDNPLIVHVSSMSMLQPLLPSDYTFSPAYQVLMKRFWPGALTFLFPRNADVVPTIITAGQPTVAVRMPSHPIARALIAVAQAPLAAPSANISGKPSPTRAEHVHRDLDGKVAYILDGGPCGVGLESTVIDGLHPDGDIRVLRPGGVTVEDIEQALRQDMSDKTTIPRVLVHKRDYADETIEAVPTTPGMKYRHYSPAVPVTLLLTQSQSKTIPFQDYIRNLLQNPTPSSAVKIGVLAPTDSRIWDQLSSIVQQVEWHRHDLGPSDTPPVIAHRLFDGLLSLEQRGVDMMLIEEVLEEREGLAVMNRVRKAAGDTVAVHF